MQKPAYTLNMICGSGMKSITEGGDPYPERLCRHGRRWRDGKHEPGAVFAAGRDKGRHEIWRVQQRGSDPERWLNRSAVAYSDGETAEAIAAHEQISRAEQDQYALDSHQKASAASRAGHFAEEIVPVTVSGKRGVSVVREDEQIRHDLSADQLAALKPAFRRDGSVTAGNASGLNDGAASVILASARAVAQYGLRPLAEIVSFGEGGVDPAMMGLGPLPAMTCALRRGRFQLSDMARLEINEAFAAQVLGVVKGLAREHQMTAEGDSRPPERQRRRDCPRAPARQFRNPDCREPSARAAPGE